MKYFIFLITALYFTSCVTEPRLDENILSEYLELNDSLEIADLVACAGGKVDGLLGGSLEPTDVFFYPIEGATDFRYFETEGVADSTDFSKYIAKDLDNEPIFNGYLWKFNNTPFTGERTGIVTYRTPGNLHICQFIRLKTNIKPTERDNSLGEVIENGVTPSFTWQDGEINENVIYFQVISDKDGNFISGTYTIEKEFTFYDLSNVVFNITDPSFEPVLEPGMEYDFTLMGVSEDNWVNLLIEKSFSTN